MEAIELINETKFICTFILIVVFRISGVAQSNYNRSKFFTGSINTGFFGVEPSSQESISGKSLSRSVGVVAGDNGRGGFSLTGTSSLGLGLGYLWQNKRNKNMWGINADFQQNRNSYVFDLPFMQKVARSGGNDNDADDVGSTADSTFVRTGTWIETDKYLKCSAGLEHLWYLNNWSRALKGDRYGYWKVSFGESFLHRNQGNVVSEGQTDSGTDKLGNVTNARTISANPVSYMLSTEIGLCSFSPDKSRSVNFGIAWHLPFTSSYTREYQFYEKEPAKPHQPASMQSIGKENVRFQGGSILLNVTYNFNSKINPRGLDTLKILKKMEEPRKEVIAKIHRPNKINGRRVKIKETIQLSDTSAVALVWDKGKVDGDRITLYLNGKVLISDYSVVKAKREIPLHLRPGSNYLVMHAINLGRIPPNTAAIEINDGINNKEIMLSSDTKTSGAIELVCFHRK